MKSNFGDVSHCFARTLFVVNKMYLLTTSLICIRGLGVDELICFANMLQDWTRKDIMMVENAGDICQPGSALHFAVVIV